MESKIKAGVTVNEIRLGNWFNHNDMWSYRGGNKPSFKFQWNENDWYALGESTLFLENVSPIELTEQVLLKCGFEKLREFYHLDYQEFCIFSDKNGYYTHINSGNLYFKSLHQLQNLYFALTGKELEFKA